MPVKKLPTTSTKRHLSTSVTVALISLCGVIITAVFGLIGVILQTRKDSVPTLTSTESQLTTFSDAATATSTNQPDWSSLFYIGLEDVCVDSLIAPDYMLPLLGTSEANTKYTDALNNGETDTWDLAYYSDEGSGYGSIFYIESKTGNQEWIRLENTFAITVYAQTVSGNMAVIENQTRCGGGDYRIPENDGLVKLSSDLSAYSLFMNYPEADYYTLQPGEPETFIFTPDCDTPGIYTLKIDIQFTYKGEKRTYPWVSPRHFVCPETFDHWGVTMFGDILKAGEYQLENSKYTKIR